MCRFGFAVKRLHSGIGWIFVTLYQMIQRGARPPYSKDRFAIIKNV
jgi:hypothetical protein